MGAGRKAAREMKAYLGLRDTDVVYLPERARQRTGSRFAASTCRTNTTMRGVTGMSDACAARQPSSRASRR